MNKNKFFYVFLFILISATTFCFSMFLFSSTSDEIWNFSFAHNIYFGLIPYRDFNMIVTPLFPLIGSLFLKIFGDYLFSIHIFGAIYISIIVLLLYKEIGWKSLICYLYLLIYYFPSYNTFILFWMFLLLYFLNHKNKYSDIICGFIIGFAFLTKQTVGITLLLPFVFYSKDKIKGFISFLIPIFIMLIYLLFHNAFYEFVDYCFLGMLDFSSSNGIGSFIIIEIAIMVYLVYCLIKSNFKDEKCFYILMFQIIAFPIVDLPHVFIAFAPVCYYFLLHLDINNIKSRKKILYLGAFGFFYIIFGIEYSNNIQFDLDNFLAFRNVDIKNIEIDSQVSLVKNYDNYRYKFYILDTACLIKLYSGEKITKFDILNNGNFGYRGSGGYISDITNLCRDSSCVFFLPYWYYDKVEGQLSKELIDYVRNKYDLVEHYKYFDVYSNR